MNDRLPFKMYQYKVCLLVILSYINYVNYAKLLNNASTINPMPDLFLTALKIHIDNVLK